MSAISGFSTSKATAGDAIYNFSNPSVAPISNARAASTTSTITNSNTATSSRPRPKPKPKTVRTAAPGDSSEKTPSSTSNIEMFDMTLSIADRAKMRKRNSDIQTSSFSVVPAYSPEILELSSDDELSLRPANKPKETTTEQKTTKKPSSTATAAKLSNHVRLVSPVQDPDTDISLSFALPMVATSPALAWSGERNRASLILPPSDPPQSTPSEYFDDIPAIETLPNPPSSATSASTSFASRTHRVHMNSDLDMPPPPAPFFADPSSSPRSFDHHPDHKLNNNINTGNSHATMQVMDSVLMPPPPIVPPGGESKVKKPRTRKRKVNDDDDDFMVDAEDWAGDEPKGKGKKAKSKSKGKDKEEKLATLKSKGKASTKVKGKGKEKQALDAPAQSPEPVEDIDELLMSTITIPPRNAIATPSNSFSPPLEPEFQRDSPSPSTKPVRDAVDRQKDKKNGEQRQASRKKLRRSVDEYEVIDVQAGVDVDDLHLGPDEYNKDMDLDVNPSKSALHKSSGKGKKGKAARVVISEDEDEVGLRRGEAEGMTTTAKSNSNSQKSKAKPRSNATRSIISEDEQEHETAAADDTGFESSTKENMSPSPPALPQTPISQAHIASSSSKLTTPATDQKQLKYPTLASRYTIAPKSARKSTPMSDLIRRVNSMPNSQFKSPVPRGRRTGGGGQEAGGGGSLTAYSPYLKSSRSFLSKIAPLHPNRRTPPPLPPAPPPRKKTRKEIEWEKKDREEREEMEERWEEELVERVGGMGEWLAMGEEMRKAMKRTKRDRELGLGGWEE
ncbi:hypothetical protein F5050DRAFT_1781555 [Lentinula boryana]|uniref:Uncharacterized protein n=1 Tax=Lentinula boryana TaxID=40481 RepID=A0ABQ8Q478_9AGAR|nr:hypothetical protein F5050DRAFT_1781555 [Lentinula boryana]